MRSAAMSACRSENVRTSRAPARGSCRYSRRRSRGAFHGEPAPAAQHSRVPCYAILLAKKIERCDGLLGEADNSAGWEHGGPRARLTNPRENLSRTELRKVAGQARRNRDGRAPAASLAVGSKCLLRGLQKPAILTSAEIIGSSHNNRSSQDSRNIQGIRNSQDIQSNSRTLVVAAWSRPLRLHPSHRRLQRRVRPRVRRQQPPRSPLRHRRQVGRRRQNAAPDRRDWYRPTGSKSGLKSRKTQSFASQPRSFPVGSASTKRAEGRIHSCPSNAERAQTLMDGEVSRDPANVSANVSGGREHSVEREQAQALSAL